ncbi:restriction endonuclease subunit S [Streptococcus sp. 27098_8_86]|uniref:restriction endonuclease subunit S n=1 Tax=Streptococcus sp. 27098_8_86 TaxID=3003670 RepID=UPI00352F32AF
MKKVKLGEVAINIDNRRKPLNNLQRSEKSFSKKYPYCGANNIIDYIDEYIFDESEEILCIAEDGGNWGKEEECTYVMNEKCWVNNHAHVLKMKTGVDINYIKLTLDYLDLTSYITGSTRGKLTKSSLDKIEINLPNYHTQISISKKISDIQKLITKKEAQIQKYNELVKSRYFEEVVA